MGKLSGKSLFYLLPIIFNLGCINSLHVGGGNSKISDSLKAVLHSRVEQIVWAFNNENYAVLDSLPIRFAKSMANTKSYLSGRHFKQSIKIFNEGYYTKNDDVDGFFFDSTSGTLYTMNSDLKKPCYIALSILDQEKSNQSFLLLTTFEFIGGIWKLSDLQFVLYKVNGKNAEGYLAMSDSLLQAGDLLTAHIAIQCLGVIVDAENNRITYLRKKLFLAKYQEIVKKIQSKYRFPMSLGSRKDTVGLYNFEMKTIHNFTYPVIYYKTDIPIRDSTDVQQQGKKLLDVFLTLFPNLKIVDSTSVILYATNEVPKNPNPNIEHYEFIISTRD